MKLTTTLYHKTNQPQAKTDHCTGLNVVTHLDTITHKDLAQMPSLTKCTKYQDLTF